MAGQLAWSQLIAAPPALVVTIGGSGTDAYDFLDSLTEAQRTFDGVADTKALWAVRVDFDAPGASEGSLFPSTGGTASAWVASAEAFKRVKALRF